MTKPNIVEHPYLDFLPESVIQLNIEVQKYHIKLFEKYSNLASLWGTPESIGILAAECNIVVDGMFDDKGIDALADLIRSRLVARRLGQSEMLVTTSLSSDPKSTD
jgi:hypothetical protein